MSSTRSSWYARPSRLCASHTEARPEALRDLYGQLPSQVVCKGLVDVCRTPFAALTPFAKRKEGARRLCADCRLLNGAAVTNAYSMLKVNTKMPHRLHGADALSKVRLCSGYQKVVISPGLVEKGDFAARCGRVQFYVLAPLAYDAARRRCSCAR